MQDELTALQPKLEVATQETDEMLKNIEIKQADANELKAVVQGEEEVCAKQAADAKAIADNCQTLLDEAIPALEAAQKALSTLKKSDMDEGESHEETTWWGQINARSYVSDACQTAENKRSKGEVTRR